MDVDITRAKEVMFSLVLVC